MTDGLMDALYLLLLILGVYLFWQWRLQEESARKHAETVCKQYKVQFLDVARSGGRLRLTPRTGWEAQFQFGFSSDTKSRYEGELTLLNLNLRDVQMPPHRSAPDTTSASNTVDGTVVAADENSPERGTNSPEPNTNSPEPNAGSSETTNNNQQEKSAPSLASRSNLHNIPAPAIAWNVTYGQRNQNDASESHADDDIIAAVFPSDHNDIPAEHSDALSTPFPIEGPSSIDG
ncbi:DUF3301 domain-containing protein [Aliidiomarina sp.]|uniref:DUF3301 domain-containing protein n=1 Tax=Aliidiomarina sp. TaxID=1872439 RepID=UPI003A4E04C3